MTVDTSVFENAILELRRRSQLAIYQTDFDAWAWDVLRLRNYEKMREITFDALFASKERTLVKSGNGTAKSFAQAQMILWAGSVFDEGQTVSIISAPSIPQLQKVTFAYLKSFHGRVSTSLTPGSFIVPGRIDENLGWVSETANGKIWLASGRKPPDQDAVSMFQGLRSQFGMTYVWFDEAGGMKRAMFTAAEAVMTGGDSRFTGIGNPDNTGTEMQAVFTDPLKAAEYNLHTISAYDTPVFTGERVYPKTPEGDEMEARMLKSLTGRRWVAHKSRIWASGGEIVPDPEYPDDRRYDIRQRKVVRSEAYDKNNPEHLGRELFTVIEPVTIPAKVTPTGTKTPAKTVTKPVKHVILEASEVSWDARGRSKVLGEFPDGGDFSFFPQSVIDTGHDTHVTEDLAVRPVFGVDIARFGSDESVIYVNRGGRLRLLDSWGKADTVETAQRIHGHAMSMNASEVRVDSTGVGGGVYDMLVNLEQFRDKTYSVIGIDGARKSPDPRRWANARAYNHEQLRDALLSGRLDLDFDDRELAEQLTNVTFRFAKSGGIQITPKDEMRTEMDGSPDRLDAAIYSVVDASEVFIPEGAVQPGDMVLLDPWEMLALSREDEDYPL